MAWRRVGLGLAMGAAVLLTLASAACDVIRDSAQNGRAAEEVVDQGPPLLASLPAQIDFGTDVPDLPTDQAIGRAAFIVTKNDAETVDSTESIYVVTIEGGVYRVVAGASRTGRANMSLSPDGRWLARLRGERWTLRDLTSVVERSVDGEDQVLDAWSMDGRSALWHKAADPGQRHYQVMDVASGQLTGVTFAGTGQSKPGSVPQLEPVILLNDHEVATVAYNTSTSEKKRLFIEVIELRTGESVRSMLIDVTSQLKPDEHLANYLLPQAFVGGGRSRLWTWIIVPTAKAGFQMFGLIGVDVASGQFLTRVDVPAPTTGDATLFAGAVPEGAVLVHRTTTGTEVSIVSDEGERRTVTELPPGVSVVSAGRQF